MDSPPADIESLALGDAKKNLHHIRYLCSRGLNGHAQRKRIWPLVLGLTERDLERDRRLLETESAKLDQFMREEEKGRSAGMKNRGRLNTPSRIVFDQDDLSMSFINVLDGKGDPEEKDEEEEGERKKLPVKDWNLIICDVNRSMWMFIQDEELTNRRRELCYMLGSLFRASKDEPGPQLHYYQGLHDIASILLLTCGKDLGFSILRRLSRSYLQDKMGSSIDYVTEELDLLWHLVKIANPRLFRFVQSTRLIPYVALPWTLTWFSHNVPDLNSAATFFDLFLSSHPLMPIYASASLMLYMSSHGLYNVRGDFTDVHDFISRFSSTHVVPYQKLLKDAVLLFDKYPPQKLLLSNAKLSGYLTIQRYPYPWVPPNEYHITPQERRDATPTHLKVGLIAAGTIAAVATLTLLVTLKKSDGV
ncbi:TBC1 domain family member 20-like [Schistocerca gregaria]|uniref:TBC1 domain family member 20-like n=1 Tax=Schistocerca gregaria TaxID=7010 RepID=UPI00211E3B99|nr:TBC1 domain family member 20-like [Schistocerca gregaria]